MQTNTRRVTYAGEEYDVPVEVYSRAMAEAELRVLRRRLVEDLAAEGDPAADRRLEDWWETATGHPRAVDLIRSDGAGLLVAWDVHEDRMRARLRLPARE